jgi:D-aspartate ligase
MILKNNLNTNHNRIGETPAVFIMSANGCNSLGVARSFGRKGIPVYVLGGPSSPLDHILSRYVRNVKSPKLDIHSSNAAEFLADFARTFSRRPVLFPTHDAAVQYCCRYRHLLEDRLNIPFGPNSAVTALLDKAQFHEVLCRTKVPKPFTIAPKNLQEAVSAGRKIGYPCIIKPAVSSEFSSIVAAKCVYLNNEDELKAFWAKYEPVQITLLLQEIIPGNRISGWIGYYNKRHDLIAYCPYAKKRQYPPDFGVGTFFRTEETPQLVDWGNEVLQEINYYGLVDVEFKFDPRDRQWKMIEINARTCMLNSISTVSGIDFEFSAYRDAIGKPLSSIGPAEMDVCWTETHKDFASAIKYRQTSFSDWRESRRGKKAYAYFCWDDPLPAIARFPEALTAILSTLLYRSRSKYEKFSN